MTGPVARLLSPEEIAIRSGQEPAFLRLPEPRTLFAEREMRLRQLAAGHALRDYLLFVAEICRAQHELACKLPAPHVPAASVFERAAALSEPPLRASTFRRNDGWPSELHSLLALLKIDGPARQVVRSLMQASDKAIEQQADALLGNSATRVDVGTGPLIGAGLQLHFSRLVAESARAYEGMRGGVFGRVGDATICPCCGSRPTASVLRIGGAASGQRYLHCSLCQAEWHMVRIKCGRCENTRGINFQQLEAATREDDASEPAAVRVECCPECKHYLKLVAMDKDPNVEPVADDLASLTLDLLAIESGLTRHGVNMLLLFADDATSGE
ncbi:MAG TPA: formate dehydrogenase accessory protein FdhE [Burkholderiaceae bacterium]|nr:formate dehydrogenase accessory protein FdhE [Burkholderiaceae bacterium]